MSNTHNRNSSPYETKDRIPVLEFEDKASLETWLSEHHDDSTGIWIKIAKKGSGIKTVSYAEAVEAALTYGWIDSQKSAYDDKYFLQKFTRRGPKSIWSTTNRSKAMALIESGKMKPSGMKQVELAKSNGEWERAYEPLSLIQVPADFQTELAKNEKAREFFSSLDKVNRYAILFRLQTTKKTETRRARIKKYIEMLSQNEKLHG